MEPTLDPRRSSPHPSEETLEKYALGQLSDAELETVETHLLVCPDCQDTLTETEQYVSAMKGALAEQAPAAQPDPTRASSPGTSPGTWMDKLLRPHPLTAFAAAAAALSLVAIVATRQSSAPTALELQAVRGGASTAVEGQANATLDLTLQSAEWSVDGTYKVRVVDGQGREVWTGVPRSENGHGVVHIDGGFSAGRYWVRLYDGKDTLLQEYGLQLQ